MGAVEAALALVGLVALILLVLGALAAASDKPSIEDPAAPYREGLHAAVRMQRVAQDLEHQLLVEAARRRGEGIY